MVTVFLVVFALLELALLLSAQRPWYDGVMTGTAVAANALINATGVPATAMHTQVFLSSRVLQIDPDCTGLPVAAIYVALILAYPVRLSTKAIGLAIGIPVILLANMARLVAVAHASELLPDNAFSFAHDYLFKVFLVAVVIAAWASWLAYARGVERRP